MRCQRFGAHRNGLHRFRCPNRKKTYTEPHKRLIEGMNLADEKALLALKLMVDGNSLRRTERITGVEINTLMKLLVRAGEKCEKVMEKLIVNIPVKDVQYDEIWALVSKKEAHKLPMEARTTIAWETPTVSLPSSAIPSSSFTSHWAVEAKQRPMLSSKACGPRPRHSASKSGQTGLSPICPLSQRP
jgi:hypothetical protein